MVGQLSLTTRLQERDEIAVLDRDTINSVDFDDTRELAHVTLVVEELPFDGPVFEEKGLEPAGLNGFPISLPVLRLAYND